MSNRFVFPKQQWVNANGNPLNGGKLYFYESGTTTPKDTYSDEALTTPNTNPVVADSAGVFPDIWMDGTYTVKLTDADDVQIFSKDGVAGPIFENVGKAIGDIPEYEDDGSGNAVLRPPYVDKAVGGLAQYEDDGSGNAIIGFPNLDAQRAYLELENIYQRYRNKLINGNFDIWQRGTSFTSSGYWADRWRGDVGGGATITQETFSPGQTDVPGNPMYYLRHDRTTAAGAANTVLEQRIESVRTLSGKTTTISLWLKAGAAKTFDVDLVQSFGSGASASADVTTAVGEVSVTTSWQRFELTISVPSISGKTIDSSTSYPDDYLAVRLREENALETFTLDVARAQVEKGSAATPFEERHVGVEIRMCRRFAILFLSCGGAGYATAASDTERANATINHDYMRAIPALTYTQEQASNTTDTLNISSQREDSLVASEISNASGSLFWRGYVDLDAEL